MTFSVARFSELRPYAYHLTAASNLDAIRSQRRLYSTTRLAQEANRSDLLTDRRKELETIAHPSLGTVVIRDQSPLFRGNIELSEGFRFEDVLADLNRRVFFWPGTDMGPIPHGMRHFGRYSDQIVAVIKVPYETLAEQNRIEYCRYNSGSPRCSGGMKSPRGPDTFQDLSAVAYSPSKVVELTVRDSATLPEETTVARSPEGPWKPLFA
mgnify:CR=1 FL=1